jgi:rSAM/selenodomain-associated transferase 1
MANSVRVFQPDRAAPIEPHSHALAVMAKAPVPGGVKSRLVPPLNRLQAASLNRCFLRDISASIESLGPRSGAHGLIAYTPAGLESAFDGLLPDSFRLLLQRGGDLGQRLFHAACDLLDANYESVCLINSDSPTLPQSILAEAIAHLKKAGDRIVLGGADDGGYYLIGLKRAHRRIFEDINWSTSAVLSQTVDRAAELGLEVVSLPLWYDVDDESSLRRLAIELFGDDSGRDGRRGSDAPFTRDFLRGLIADGLAARLDLADLLDIKASG